MKRSIINSNQAQKTMVNHFATPTVSSAKVALSEMALEKRLRLRRSSEYLQAFKKLDAGGTVCNHASIEELKLAIEKEFPDLDPHQYPIGILAKCYLGYPYEVHTLDVALDITEHYKKGQSLPPHMDRGKSLALHPSYEFIEVYHNSLRAVSSNGDVSIIKG